MKNELIEIIRRIIELHPIATNELITQEKQQAAAQRQKRRNQLLIETNLNALGIGVVMLSYYLGANSVALNLAAGVFINVVYFVIKMLVTKARVSQKTGDSIASDKPNQKLLFAAGFLFPSQERESALGDLEEKFERACLKFGKSKANIYLAYDVFRTFLSKSKPNIVFLLKWAGITSLATLLTQIQNIYNFFFQS